MSFDLLTLANDVDGDRIQFRLDTQDNMDVELKSALSRALLRPASGFSGLATAAIIVDDGYDGESLGQIDVTVSDAMLVASSRSSRHSVSYGSSQMPDVRSGVGSVRGVPIFSSAGGSCAYAVSVSESSSADSESRSITCFMMRITQILRISYGECLSRRAVR